LGSIEKYLVVLRSIEHFDNNFLILPPLDFVGWMAHKNETP
jgi:hypothetical protein